MRRMNGDKGKKGSRKILTWSLLIDWQEPFWLLPGRILFWGERKKRFRNGWTGRSRRGSPGRSSVSMLLRTVTAKEDQELKMEVKKTVVAYLKENLGEEAGLEKPEAGSWKIFRK